MARSFLAKAFSRMTYPLDDSWAQHNPDRIAAIKANPQASAADLHYLVEIEAEAALAHPNCPVETWWGLAALYPLEAMQSVLYPVLTLESPERWAESERHNLDQWVEDAIDRLPFAQKEAFAADCAAHVLRIWEAKFPEAVAVRNCIEVRRLYARGACSIERWVTAQEVTVKELNRDYMTSGPKHACRAAVADLIEDAANDACAAFSDQYPARIGPAATELWHQERAWQWDLIKSVMPSPLPPQEEMLKKGSSFVF